MKQVILRVRYNHETHKWYAVALDRDGNERAHREPGRSPEGTELEAEHYMEVFRKYGAWLKS